MLLQTLNTLFFRGLPGSQELNQQLANHFTEKVERHLLCPIHAYPTTSAWPHWLPAAGIHELTQLVIAATPLWHCLLRDGHLPTHYCLDSSRPPSAKVSSALGRQSPLRSSPAEGQCHLLHSVAYTASGPIRPRLLCPEQAEELMARLPQDCKTLPVTPTRVSALLPILL